MPKSDITYDVLNAISNQSVIWEDHDFEIIKQQMLGRVSLIAQYVDYTTLIHSMVFH